MCTQIQSKKESGLLNQSSGLKKSVLFNLFLLILLISTAGIVSAQSSQTPTQTVCVGTEPYLVTPTTGSTYNWSISPGTSGTDWAISGGTSNSISVSWNMPGVYTLTVIQTDIAGCIGLPVSVTVTVNPLPTVIDPGDQIICNGAQVNSINFTGAVTGTVYNWTNDTPSIGLAASGSGNIASFNAVNTGSTPVIATVSVTPSYTNAGQTCTGTPQTFTITVTPIATVNSIANVAYCNGATTSTIPFSSNVTGATFNWTNSNTAIGLGANGTGDLPSFTAANTGTNPITATITVTPNANGCSGTPLTFTITVNPRPVPTISAATNPICFGTIGVYTTQSGMASYSWTVTAGTVTSGGGITDNSVTVNWNGTAPYSVSVNYTNTSGCTATDPTVLPVTVTPQPVTSPIFHN